MSEHMTTAANIQEFQEAVWDYYAKHGRHDMVWRQPDVKTKQFDPYKIMVSEIMLQQTQVSRVEPKYQAFLQQFPDIQTLATSQLGEVLRTWQGLGYNRRAKFIWQAAQQIMLEFRGIMPQNIDELVKLPGIGKNTAAAIVAYTWSQPVVYVETNIRTAVIYHFFTDTIDCSDKEILEVVKVTLPEEAAEIRNWYWALMDYGQYIKRVHGNLNKLSKQYTKQSEFQGSNRQLRGQILRLLSVGPVSKNSFEDMITDTRLKDVLDALESEQIIRRSGDQYSL